MRNLTKSDFKKILIFQIVLSFISIFKLTIYPYGFAPEELAKAMIMFDELQPLFGIVPIILLIVIFIVFIVSIIKLYQFKKIGRTLYVITLAGYCILAFVSTYYVYDVVEMLLEYILAVTTCFTIAIMYYSNLNKLFK